MKVGIIQLGNSDWLGGMYYTRTVARAAQTLKHQVCWFKGSPAESSSEDGLLEVQAPNPGRLLGRAIRLVGISVGHREPLVEYAARKHRIEVLIPLLSSLGRACRLGWIGWIPDFQHIEQPSQFSPRGIASRDRQFGRLAIDAPVLAFSSEHAASVARDRYPGVDDKVAVLRFAASLSEDEWSTEVGALLDEYGLTEPFVYLPSQFWTHKNHRTVFRAWNLLGPRAPLLVCTGNQSDHRNPRYFEELCRELNETTRPRVRILGIVPRAKQIALFKSASLLLNPSLYEGWSTTVEEARAFGKRLLLSDLPIFREQAGTSADYFPPTAPEVLAEIVDGLKSSLVVGRDLEAEAHGRLRHDERREAFEQSLAAALAKARRLS